MRKGYILAAAVIIGAICLLGLSACTLGAAEGAQTEWGEWTTVTVPNCEEEGAELRVSLNDASVTETRAIAPLGHSWGDWIVAVVPSCTFAGTEERVCSVCGNKDMRSVAALGHSFGEWESVVEPTCLTNGMERRVCSTCANEESRAVYALGHDFCEWVIDARPTCTADGIEKRVCRNDNAHAEYRHIEALGHAWGAGEVILAPTCESDGEAVRTCEHDNAHKIHVPVRRLGHDFSEYVTSTAPTETENGIETAYCVNDPAHTMTRTAYATGSDCLDYYPIDSGSEYSVTMGYENEIRSIIYIPEYHDGKPVTQIQSGAFRQCGSIEKIVFLGNSNIVNIDNSAFQHLPRLKTVELPDSVIRIGMLAFANCDNLEKVVLPSGLEYLHGVNPFTLCDKLMEITMRGEGAKYVAEGNCVIDRQAKELIFACPGSTIPGYVETINKAAFNRINIESIFIPKSVKKLNGALKASPILKEVVFENGSALEFIELYEFSYTDLTRITIPNSVKSIGRSAFQGCKKLTEVTFEEGSTLQKIENYIFSGCESLTAIKLPDTITEIAESALKACVNLQEIEIPAGVTNIGSNAFDGFTPTQTIIINGLSSIEEANALWGEAWRENCYAEIVFRP